MRKRSIITIIVVSAAILAVVAAGAVHAYSAASRILDNLYGRLDTLQSSVWEDKDELHEAVYNLHRHYSFEYSWTKNANNLIAHALGGIDNCVYTNSLEDSHRRKHYCYNPGNYLVNSLNQ